MQGLPLHVQIDTFEDHRDAQIFHRGYCQIKVFCDKVSRLRANAQVLANYKPVTHTRTPKTTLLVSHTYFTGGWTQNTRRRTSCRQTQNDCHRSQEARRTVPSGNGSIRVLWNAGSGQATGTLHTVGGHWKIVRHGFAKLLCARRWHNQRRWQRQFAIFVASIAEADNAHAQIP